MFSQQKGYAVKVARSVDDVKRLRKTWQMLKSHPNAQIDFYLTIINHRPYIQRPHIIVVENDAGKKLLVVGRIEGKRLCLPMGYKRVYAYWVRKLTVVYGGVLGEQSPEMCLAAHVELRAALSRREADLISFEHLRLDSVFYRTALAHYPFLLRDWFCLRNPHHQSSVNCPYEEFCRRLSRNTRKSLNRYSRRLVDKYGSDLSIECLDDPRHAARLLQDTESVAAMTYQRAMGVGFINNTETHSWIRLEMSRRRFRCYLAYIGGKCVAFSHILIDGDTAYAMDTGYDPNYADFRIGHFLNHRVIKDLCADPRVVIIDFGLGDADYKQSLCDGVWDETILNVFAPTPKGFASKTLLEMAQTISVLGRSLLKRSNLLQTMKRFWRNHLHPKPKQVTSGLSSKDGFEAFLCIGLCSMDGFEAFLSMPW